MKGADVSLLRKQQARLLGACTVLLWNSGVPGNMESSYVLDCRLCGNDTLGLPARERAGCSIRLKCYRFAKINRIRAAAPNRLQTLPV